MCKISPARKFCHVFQNDSHETRYQVVLICHFSQSEVFRGALHSRHSFHYPSCICYQLLYSAIFHRHVHLSHCDYHDLLMPKRMLWHKYSLLVRELMHSSSLVPRHQLVTSWNCVHTTRWSGDVIRRTGTKNFNAVSHNRARPYFRIQHGRGEVRARRVYLNVHSVTGNVVDTEWSVEFWRWKCFREFGNNRARLWDTALKFFFPVLQITSPDHLEITWTAHIWYSWWWKADRWPSRSLATKSENTFIWWSDYDLHWGLWIWRPAN